MTLAIAWLLYPGVLALLGLGLGSGLERLSGRRLPGVLILPTGVAALVALARLLTGSSVSAPLALPIIGGLALLGLAIGGRSLAVRRPEPWTALAGLGVLAVFAVSVILSLAPSFTGYTSLPDTSHQLSLAELFAQHGPDWEALPPGSERLSLSGYVATAYPVGAHAALGVTAPLGVVDLAWLYQPLIAVFAVVGALALSALVEPWVRDSRVRAFVVFVAAQPALLYAYAQQGSIKEVGAAALLVTVIAQVTITLHRRWPARTLLPASVAAAAGLGVIGPVMAVYLVPVIVVALLAYGWRLWRAPRRLAELGWLLGVAVAGAVLVLPVLLSITTAIYVGSGTLDRAQDLGHLAGPLRPTQAFGVWLNGDYRYMPASRALLVPLLGATIVAAGLGLAWAARRRALGPLLLAGAVIPASLYLVRRGSPYADAKVLAILSPTLLLLATLGPLALWSTAWSSRRLTGLRMALSRGRRAAAFGLAALVGAGVVGSNALVYHDVSLAPYDRYAELVEINQRLAGRGPAIFTEYDEFAKYFLGDVPVFSQPEYPHGYRTEPYEPNALVDPARRPSLKTPLDLDDLTLKYLESVPYIVMRRSPTASRPPANFERAWEGRFYGVWRRTGDTQVLAHVPLGANVFEPADRASCATVRRMADTARRAYARLAYVERSRIPTLVTASVENRPASWTPYSLYPGAVVPLGAGRLQAGITVPRTASYRVWVEGSFGREVRVLVDGREVGSVEDELNNPGAYLPLDEVRLSRGAHSVQLVQGGGDLSPGSGGFRASLRHLGPVVFSPPSNQRRAVEHLQPEEWRRLCGRRLDWVEVVRPASGSGAQPVDGRAPSGQEVAAVAQGESGRGQ